MTGTMGVSMSLKLCGDGLEGKVEVPPTLAELSQNLFRVKRLVPLEPVEFA